MVIVMKKTDLVYRPTLKEVFLSQLNYVIGADKLAETVKGTTTISSSSTQHRMIKRTAERFWCKLRLVLVDWTQTTNTIDYGIKA
jgi:hypothetical protein